MGPIPWSAIDLYARRQGFNPELSEFFVDVIMLLDQDYREYLEEEERKKQSREARRQRRKAGGPRVPAKTRQAKRGAR